MAAPIYIIGGCKGGVGKSMLAQAILDYLGNKGDDIFLIDSDTSNPDVYKTYGETYQSQLLNLDEDDGWIDLVDICDENPTKTIVISTAARNNAGVDEFGGNLNYAVDALKRDLITLWIVNTDRDSLELLSKYRNTITAGTCNVIRNEFFGKENEFQLYNGSKLKTEIEDAGGKTVNFPRLAKRVAKQLYTERLQIADAAKSMPLGSRIELQRWRSEVKKMLDEVTP